MLLKLELMKNLKHLADETDWYTAKSQLAGLFGGHVYPSLLSDPGYRKLLWNAGLAKLPGVEPGKKVPEDFKKAQRDWAASKPMLKPPAVPKEDELSQPQKDNLKQAAALEVSMTFLHLNDQFAVAPNNARAQLLEGNEYIYRVWDRDSFNETRHWWFSQSLKDQALKESAAQGITPQEWIRDALAISLDWGKCDRLSRISLRAAGAIPAIVAIGLEQPKRVLLGAKNGKFRSADADYWKRINETFRGQEIQYFVPFLPPEHIKTWSWERG